MLSPKEKGIDIANQYVLPDYTKMLLAMQIKDAIQSALAERTEQCAKIAEDRIRLIVNTPERDLEGFDLDGWHIKSYCEGSACEAQAIMDAIRALNQPEKPNAAIQEKA